jgi:hypothetical protein
MEIIHEFYILWIHWDWIFLQYDIPHRYIFNSLTVLYLHKVTGLVES